MKNDRESPETSGTSAFSESSGGVLLRRVRAALVKLWAARAALHARTKAPREEIVADALRGAWAAMWGGHDAPPAGDEATSSAPPTVPPNRPPPAETEGERSPTVKVPPPPAPSGASRVDVTLDVNGAQRTISIEPRVTLLDALREEMGLTGTKKGCDHGQCGACTVLSDGRAINACMTLAIMQQGARITTIEGLARGGELSPVQAAFIEHDAFQCGYCTPGQIVSATALVAKGERRKAHEIREHMSGNLCRCGAYDNIVAAVIRAQALAASADEGSSEEE